MKFGNITRSATIAGEDWHVEVKLDARDDDAYQRAKQAIRDLVAEDPNPAAWSFNRSFGNYEPEPDDD